MRKIYVLIILVLVCELPMFAGGIVTNTNQSTAWIRMVSRDASTDVDAVFYNPAGLTNLEDGFYFQFNNQTISQRREIVNTYSNLNNHSYKGDIFIPLLPTAFVVYKKGKWAGWGGFTVIGGGGKADYENGLPSFEIPFSDLKQKFAPLKNIGTMTGTNLEVTGYSTDVNFNGSSTYFGIQVGASYKINDIFSVSIGGRYVMAKNTYEGYISNINIIQSSGAMRADKFLTESAIPAISGLINKMKPLNDNASLVRSKLESAIGNNLIRPEDALTDASAIGVLKAAGKYTDGMNNGTAVEVFKAINNDFISLNTNKAVLEKTAPALADKYVDVDQTGSGFAPIIGLNINLLNNKMNIGLKYEGKTSMKVKNNTTADSLKMFPDGEKTYADMPALFTAGVNYKVLSNFRMQAGFHYYFDRDANYGKKLNGEAADNTHFIDDNSYELSLGLEFDLNDKLLLSTGYMFASTSPSLAYQTDMSYTLKSHTIGFGGNYKVSPKLSIDLGILYSSYVNGSKDIQLTYGSSRETYYKSHVVGSIGITYNFSK